MSDIGSLPTASGPAAAQAAGGAGVAVGEVAVEGVPARLSQMSRPVVLSGTVVGQTEDGATRIRTQAGEVVVRISPPLPADSAVTLKIGAGSPPTRAAAFLPALPNAAATLAALPLPAGADEPATRLAQGLAAKLARTAAGAKAGLPPPETVVPGQVLSEAPARPAAHPQPPALPSPAPAGGPAEALLPEPPDLAPGSTVAVRILGTAGETAEAGAPRPGGALILTGTIAGSTADGQPILVTAKGSLALAMRGPLPQGMKLTVEVSDPRQLVFTHPADAIEGAATGAAAGRWPALSETLATLGGLEGALAQSLLGTVVPQPNRKLAAALAFFLDAARRGKAREWLGEEAGEALEKGGRSDLLKSLEGEFRALTRDAAQTPPGEWHPLPIPFWNGTAFERLELLVRAPRDDEDGTAAAGGGERGHRFILDLDLSRLGALQLDGLVKAKSRRFDLILRSREPLPDPLRAELIDAFSGNLDAVGFAGGLSFQTGGRSWVKPPPVVKRGGGGVVA